jgi:broad specificity phosphatase PhoE
MPVLLHIWVVRHGQTVANVGRIMQGQGEGELTELGIAQAAALVRNALLSLLRGRSLALHMSRSRKVQRSPETLHAGTTIT